MSKHGRKIKIELTGKQYYLNKNLESIIDLKLTGNETNYGLPVSIPILFRNDLKGRPRVILRKIIEDFIAKNYVTPADVLFDLVNRKTNLSKIFKRELEAVKIRKALKELQVEEK